MRGGRAHGADDGTACYGYDEEDGVEKVNPELVVPEHDVEAASEGRSCLRIALVERGFDGAGGGEAHGAAAKPGGEEKGADNC